jgi:hypothetical protein
MEDQNLPAHARRVVQLSLFPANETPAARRGRSPRSEGTLVVGLDVRVDRERGPAPSRRRFRLVAVWHDQRWKAARVHRSRGGMVTVLRRVTE